MNEHFSLRRAILLSLALLAASCSGTQQERQPPPLEGAAIGGAFELTGENGDTVRDSDFEGEYRLIYFGYTFCPDVCPVDMQKLGQAMRILDESDPDLAARIQPIFVSVDPNRDTPEVLREFTDSFHPRLLGLTGPQETIDAVTREYGIYYALGEDDGSGNYLVDHSNNVTLYGPEGEPLALIPLDGTPEAAAEEIRRWAA